MGRAPQLEKMDTLGVLARQARVEASFSRTCKFEWIMIRGARAPFTEPN
jgi:hypothetical protein